MTGKTAAWWVTIVALFGVLLTPLFVMNGFFFPFITGKAFYFRICVEVAAAGYLVLALADKKYRPQWSWLLALFFAFVAWTFLADLFAVNPAKALWSNFERMEGWVTIIHLFLLFIVASSILSVDKLWEGFWKTSLGISLVVGLYGLFQLAGLAAIHQGSNRLDATFGNATYLAIYFLMHLFIAGWLMGKERDWQRYVFAVLIVFETMLLVFTETRGALLGLVAGAFVAALLAALVSGPAARKYAGGAVLFLVLLVGGFMLVKNEPWVQNNSTLSRIASISLEQGQVRFQIWHIAWQGFLERPVTGWGQEGFNYVFNKYYDPALYAQEPWFDRAHNEYIDWLVAGGLPAFLLYISLFISSFWLLWRRDFSNAERIGFTALLVGYGVNNFFVFDNLMSYVLFAAALAYIHGRVSVPFTKFDALREATPERLATLYIPLATVLGIVCIYFVNVPNMRAATDLITAISPQQGGIQANLAAFQTALGDGSFADQEIREQLVSVASSVVGQQSVSDADKTAVVTMAVKEMGKQVALLPEDARLRLQLAIAYSTGNDSVDALKQMAVARTLSPNKEAILTQEGMTMWEAGDVKGAAADFKRAYELGPSFDELALYAVVGDFITGNEPAGRALLLSRFGTTTVDSNLLMLAYYRTKNWDDLIAIWQLRLQKDTSANTYFGLASSYAAAGRKADALAAVRAAVAAHPDVSAEGAAFIQQIQALP